MPVSRLLFVLYCLHLLPIIFIHYLKFHILIKLILNISRKMEANNVFEAHCFKYETYIIALSLPTKYSYTISDRTHL